MDAETALAYERDAQNWVGSRSAAPRALRRLGELTSALAPGARVADLGCGPGWYAAALARSGFAPVALDLSAAMLTELRRRTPGTNAVRGNLAALPFARGSLDGAIAFNTYQHLPEHALPSALARLHDALRVDAPIEFTIGNLESVEVATQRVGRGVVEQRWNKDPYPGRLFSFYSAERIESLLRGAGFSEIRIDRENTGQFWLWIRANRADTLSDYVRPNLDVLFCGLNPSLRAAETGVPYGRPGNRFWPAALRAGLCSRDRDPWHALTCGVGFTDLVKRPTRAASELTADEYAAGVLRVEDLVRFFRPRVVCFVGLDGWRRAVDRRAVAGWVPSGFAGRPTYLMPSTSGLNAHCDLPGFVHHLQMVMEHTSDTA
jgi:TDG/mug DNA glycosylase family protein